eukprot:3703481-Pyramimonas_sp.AAC.1
MGHARGADCRSCGMPGKVGKAGTGGKGEGEEREVEGLSGGTRLAPTAGLHSQAGSSSLLIVGAVASTGGMERAGWR